MIVADLIELSIVTVLNRGEPNRECIAIRASEKINLGKYGLMLGPMHLSENGAFPIKDNLFWFGDGEIEKDDWVFVYTGTGEPTKRMGTNDTNQVYTIYWGKNNTVFANPVIVPILFRVDAVDILTSPKNVPQLSSEGSE